MAQQVIKLVWKGLLLSSVETRTMFYYGCDTGAPSMDDAAALATAVRYGLGYFNTHQTTEFHYYEVEAFFLNMLGDWITFYVHPETQAGLAEDDISAFQVAALVSAKTSVFKARGRKFLPGITEASTESGEITDATRTHLLEFLNVYLASVNVPATGRTWFPGVVSKNSVFAPFSSGNVSSFLSTMRRRKPGYGI
jgi:hypothetical protein